MIKLDTKRGCLVRWTKESFNNSVFSYKYESSDSFMVMSAQMALKELQEDFTLYSDLIQSFQPSFLIFSSSKLRNPFCDFDFLSLFTFPLLPCPGFSFLHTLSKLIDLPLFIMWMQGFKRLLMTSRVFVEYQF